MSFPQLLTEERGVFFFHCLCQYFRCPCKTSCCGRLITVASVVVYLLRGEESDVFSVYIVLTSFRKHETEDESLHHMRDGCSSLGPFPGSLVHEALQPIPLDGRSGKETRHYQLERLPDLNAVSCVVHWCCWMMWCREVVVALCLWVREACRGSSWVHCSLKTTLSSVEVDH